MSVELAKVLYLGLRAKPNTYHYPVIRTEFCADLAPALALWDRFTHLIFTSQTAVAYWPGPWDKQIIAIGEATGQALRHRGLHPQIAPEPTQEGIIQLLQNLSGYFLIPRSRRARPLLAAYLRERQIPHLLLDLYDTHFQKPEPVPNLAHFEEIVFTSPSTVEGFLRIYGAFPPGKKLTPIGPVTAQKLDEAFNQRMY